MDMREKYKRIGDLFDSLEAWGFQCPGGPLKHAVPWIILRQAVYEKLTEAVPQSILDKYLDLYGEGNAGDFRDLDVSENDEDE